jgi:hypothetical protein
MSKWKWISQDYDGEIYKYRNESGPRCVVLAFFSDDGEKRLVERGIENPNFKDTLINLEKEDYEINDGILLGIPRKTHLDKLIANVKKINKKAAKWMNKNRYKLDDVDDLSLCFNWDDCEKYDWCDIYEKLEEMAEQQPAKETLKYRVGLCDDKGKKYLMFAVSESNHHLVECQPNFVSWLTDWIEVEV